MSMDDTLKKLEQVLRSYGVVGANFLLKELKVSRATLMRLLAQRPHLWVSIGKTHNQQYGGVRSIEGLGQEVPLFRVNEEGSLILVGRFHFIWQNFYLAEPGGQVFKGLPPEIHDMSPEGFLGRIFAKTYSDELHLPQRLEDWSEEHILKASAFRGEDFPGNFIVGEESAQRWKNLKYVNTSLKKFSTLVDLALSMGSVGSSAGGERSKFTATMDHDHVMVKFAGPLTQADQRRWADLLYCEKIVYSVLQTAGIECASTKCFLAIPKKSKLSHRSEKYFFLIAKRFDRVGLKGRKPYLSFAAVEDFLFGGRQSWSHTAEKLFKSKRLSKKDFDTVRLVEAFCILIGDTDRHFNNMGLIPEFKTPSSLTPNYFKLAPIFDKSPMQFAPYDGRVIDREFDVGVPPAILIDVWPEGADLAKIFWKKVLQEKEISPKFKKIAASCLEKIAKNIQK